MAAPIPWLLAPVINARTALSPVILRQPSGRCDHGAFIRYNARQRKIFLFLIKLKYATALAAVNYSKHPQNRSCERNHRAAEVRRHANALREPITRPCDGLALCASVSAAIRVPIAACLPAR